MSAAIAIPTSGPLRGRIRPPGSKSLSNRALLCAGLARGTAHLQGLLQSDDTEVMVAALRQLGVSIDVDWSAATATVDGRDGRWLPSSEPLLVGNSGTTARFLVPAVAACGTGRYRVDGSPRMRERPMRDLVRALQDWGCQVVATEPAGALPLDIVASRPCGGRYSVAVDQSSQFLSGLLLASPFAESTTAWSVQGKLVSAPFVEMTRHVMACFGVTCQDWEGGIEVAPGGYRGCDFVIEPDATAASYFFAAAAICGGEICVEGLGQTSCQGDLRFVELLRQMGCRVEMEPERTWVRGGELHGITCDLGDISDTVPTLAVVALFAQGETVIRGVAHNRWKESNRIDDLAREIQRMGGEVTPTADGLRIRAGNLHAAELQTYEDHRLAMSLALAGLRVPGIRIVDPGCVAKTYPQYFEDLGKLLAQSAT